jgi:hypothetical protein
MRALRFLSLGILATLIASSAVLYAQDEKPQEDKPKQEEPKQQDEPRPAAKQDEARPAAKQDEARPAAKQDEMKAPQQDEAKPARPEQQEQKQDDKQPREEARPAQQEPARQEPARQEAARPDDHARPEGNGGRIPDDRFRAQFGREHHFAMPRPEVVSGRPQFQYGGYTFVLVDAWPPAWAYSDDCYVDYVDGEYFLFDLRHPGARLALTVVM